MVKNKQDADRISDLHDFLILHILSFLPSTRDAVKTGVLSKRWRSLWTHLQSLSFHLSDSSHSHSERQFVDTTLFLHSSPKIKSFRLEVHHDWLFKSATSNIHSWLRFALEKNAEELSLDRFGEDDDNYDVLELHCPDSHFNYFNPYCFEQDFYANRSLKTLRTRLCDFEPKGKVRWGSLRVLDIGFATLGDEAIENILSGSPVLESLRLHACKSDNKGIAEINIASKSLQKLVIDGIWDPTHGEDESEVRIQALYIKDLEISGYWYRRKCRLLVVSPSLIRAKLSLYFDDDVNKHKRRMVRIMVRELVEKVQHARELKLGNQVETYNCLN